MSSYLNASIRAYNFSLLEVKFDADTIDAYKAFLQDKLRQNDWQSIVPKSRPSAVVDEVWHYHMLIPTNYAAMCRSVFGDIMYHNPSTMDQQDRAKSYAETRLRVWNFIDKTAARHFDRMWPHEDEDEDEDDNVVDIISRPQKRTKPADDDDDNDDDTTTTMQLFVKGLRGETYAVQMDVNDTVKQLAEKIQARDGIPLNQMRLIFAGRQLVFSDTLVACGIRREATVHLILRLSGC